MGDSHRPAPHSDAAITHTEKWRELFHSYDDFASAPPLSFAISGFLQKDAVTMIAGPSGDGKTLIMLAMSRALLDGTPLFDHEPFSVPEPASRVIYLVPECSIGPFRHRVGLFKLMPHIASGRLLVRTLSHPKPLPSLNDARLLEAARGAHVFLDTAVRFMQGDESAASDASAFAQTLFTLQAAGALTITGAHHAPKASAREDYMTLENVLRGSGDIGAMLATCWGIRQVEESTTRIYVQNVKPRDFQPCEPFVLEGRPHIDQCGTLLMFQQPGEAGELKDHQRGSKTGRPQKPNREEKKQRAIELASAHSVRTIAAQMGEKKSTVHRWLKEGGISAAGDAGE